MNKVILMGRLTADPTVRHTTGDSPMAIANYNLAVDRIGRDGGVDYPSISAAGKSGEFAEKYLKKGMKIIVTGHLTTGSYVNKEGQKIYTTVVYVENQEFAESKKSGGSNTEGGAENHNAAENEGNGFVSIPDGIDEELPFN